MQSDQVIRFPRPGAGGYPVIEWLAGLPSAAARWLRSLRDARAKARARDELAALSDHMLRDIGLRRGEIDTLYR